MISRVYLGLAIGLPAVGGLELFLGSFTDQERLITALALPAITVPLAWAPRAPLVVLAVITLTLPIEAAVGGVLVGQMVTTVVVLAAALYAAGRGATGGRQAIAAGGLALALAATRVAFDPAAQNPREVLLTLVAVAVPLLLGRWARGQTLLQRTLAERADRRARDRKRQARHAAERERGRIADDLQVAVAGALQGVLDDTATVHERLRTGDTAAARERLAGIADAARSALADVRRVLGVLRQEGVPAPLSPPASGGPARSEPPSAVSRPADTPSTRTPRRGRLATRADLLLATLVLVAIGAELALNAPAGQRVPAPLTAVPIALPLLWRRRHPLLVGLAVLAAIALQSALLELDSFPTGDIAAIVCASFAIGAYADDRAGLAGLLLVGAGATTHAALFYPEGVVPALLGGVALPWMVGRVVRSNRRLTQEGRRRHAEVEKSRAEEARAAVTRERLRVARELHDAVAHNISVIAIHAGGAEGLVERDPQRAQQYVELIAEVTREALAELGRLTGVQEAGGPPSLAEVDLLADRARATGLSVELRVEGPVRALPAGIALTAYRILQEGLANISKHARADRAWLSVRHTPGVLELELTDDGQGRRGGRSAREGGGHGLIGMRERVAVYGGSLEAGPGPSGGFRVHARLPLGGT